jgi:site-specific recombinase XerD
MSGVHSNIAVYQQKLRLMDGLRQALQARHFKDDKWLMASLMYGAGLRLIECLCLRAQDMDFARNAIMVRDGNGAKDRITMLPQSIQ